ncbi:MAG TPA: PDZ domain-containing protein [Terriglobales bacterium]|nr:PDZ domain-containing protein [Terriglobales bacterium]
MASAAGPAVRYTISLAHPEQHLVHVKMELPPGTAERDLQLPVWNALYQVRDFAQYVNWVKAGDLSGHALTVRDIDKSRWQISGAAGGALVEYEIFADQPGPYNAQLNAVHGFFNFAEILMYAVDQRSAPVTVSFAGLPTGWKVACALQHGNEPELAAESYDRLVDSPVELGSFEESDLEQGGARYRVVVDADKASYDMRRVVSTVRRVAAAATKWMNDRPFESYLFIYHFPQGPSGGGMEHAYSTAIDVNAQLLADNPLALPDVTAHEFFHLWNVKRIRPQSLEPVDYTKEQYTPSLWFSEGFTDTVQNYIEMRAGYVDEPGYFQRIANEIAALERRPAHLTQSAESSSRDAWLEKYSYYRLPERSISYYNKGDLIGIILDLAMRDASQGRASLHDLFLWMNRNYAQQGRFFADSAGIREAAETLTHADLKPFFEKYVAGTVEIPWDDFFKTAGLRLVRRPGSVADLGFSATRNFGAPPSVAAVSAGSAAQQAGLSTGDSILKINGRDASSDFQQQLANLAPGDAIRLRVKNRHGERDLQWTLGTREEVEFELRDVDNMTPQQKARRAAWLSGDDEGE